MKIIPVGNVNVLYDAMRNQASDETLRNLIDVPVIEVRCLEAIVGWRI